MLEIDSSPIREPECFIGRKAQARVVFSRLGNMESSSILGGRRIGKTSFLKYISHADTLRKFGHDPDRYLVAFIDFQGFKSDDTPVSFWRAVLEAIAAQAKEDVRHRDFQSGLIRLSKAC
jgi:hypothetical protein